MSKRRPAAIGNVLSWLRRGDGQGQGASYRPFYHVRDVPSHGRSSMVQGLKTGRTHHYLSDIEYGYHLLAEYSERVIDIREQYALLPWEETQKIAADLGIRHPMYIGSGIPRVMTSDLVLTLTPGSDSPYIVICCKAASALDPANSKTKRTAEKLLLEKTYWSRRHVRWVLATDAMLPSNKVFNLGFFRQSVISRELDWLNELFSDFRRVVHETYASDIPLSDLLKGVADRLGIRPSDAFTLLGRAVWTRLLPVDLDSRRISHDMPLPLRNSRNSEPQPMLSKGGQNVQHQ